MSNLKSVEFTEGDYTRLFSQNHSLFNLALPAISTENGALTVDGQQISEVLSMHLFEKTLLLDPEMQAFFLKYVISVVPNPIRFLTSYNELICINESPVLSTEQSTRLLMMSGLLNSLLIRIHHLHENLSLKIYKDWHDRFINDELEKIKDIYSLPLAEQKNKLKECYKEFSKYKIAAELMMKDFAKSKQYIIDRITKINVQLVAEKDEKNWFYVIQNSPSDFAKIITTFYESLEFSKKDNAGKVEYKSFLKKILIRFQPNKFKRFNLESILSLRYKGK